MGVLSGKNQPVRKFFSLPILGPRGFFGQRENLKNPQNMFFGDGFFKRGRGKKNSRGPPGEPQKSQFSFWASFQKKKVKKPKQGFLEKFGEKGGVLNGEPAPIKN